MTLTNCARLIVILLSLPLFSQCAKEEKREAHQHAAIEQSWEIFITTYNTGGKMPDKKQFAEWFKSHESHPAKQDHLPYDLVVVGLQETTEMKFGSFKYFLQPAKEKTITKKWTDDIKLALNQMAKKEEDKYSLHSSHEMVALFLAVFVRNARKHSITQIHTDHVETGILNKVGNKGGVGISMTIDSALHLVFVNSHIMHGPSEKAMRQRNKNYHRIKDTLNFRRKNKKGTNPQKIEDHHLVFWMGDLNYRLTNDKSVRFKVVSEACTLDQHHNAPDKCMKYLEHDELRQQKEAGHIFKNFHEGDIDFRPTYKFELNKNTYTGEKEKLPRIPAWCDRILFKTETNSCNLQLKQKTYGSVEAVDVSDHKPVYGSFTLTKHIVHGTEAAHCEAGKVFPLKLPNHHHESS